MISPLSSSSLLMVMRYQQQHTRDAERAAARLASGRRFNSAAEDPVGMVQEQTLISQRSGVAAARRSAGAALSTASVVDGGLTSTLATLQRYRELVAGADLSTATSRTAAQSSVTALNAELERLADGVRDASGRRLLDGSIASTGISFQLGEPGSSSVELRALSVRSTDLGSGNLRLSAVDLTAGGNSARTNALSAIDAAIDAVRTSAGSVGSILSVSELREGALVRQHDLVSAQLSRLTMVDEAEEMATLTRSQTLAQVAAALYGQQVEMYRSRISMLL